MRRRKFTITLTLSVAAAIAAVHRWALLL